MRNILLLLCVALAGACSGFGTKSGPDVTGASVSAPLEAGGAALPVPSRPIAVHYVSLRDRTASRDPAAYYGNGRGAARFGVCRVSWGEGSRANETPENAAGSSLSGSIVTRSKAVLEDIVREAGAYLVDHDAIVSSVVEQERTAFWSGYVAENRGRKPVLFVHGYNTEFDKGCKEAARFAFNLGLGSRLLLFSWPSNGSVLDYTSDEADNDWSVAPLSRTLAVMASQFGRGGFDIVARSLGARGLVRALACSDHVDAGSLPIADRLVLLAPDIDADVFRQELPALRNNARSVTVYASALDSAMTVSHEVHGYPRLGEAGPHLAGLEGVEVIDVSDLPVRRVSGHLYHLFNETVIRDLDEMLNGRLVAAQRSSTVATGPRMPGYWRLKYSSER